MRSELHAAVDIYQLEGHGKVLVAVGGERDLGLGRKVHPAIQQTNPQVLLATAHSLFEVDSFNLLPGGLGANALVLVHHREVHVGDGHLGGHLHFKLVG